MKSAASLPAGYKTPREGYQVFAERMAGREPDLPAAYRAQLLRQEFAAEQIVRGYRSDGREGKLIVFLAAEDIVPGGGVPYFVAQKLKVRQVVLGPDQLAPATRPLLTSAEIVDRAPVALCD